MEMQAANLQNLPENYVMKFCLFIALAVSIHTDILLYRVAFTRCRYTLHIVLLS